MYKLCRECETVVEWPNPFHLVLESARIPASSRRRKCSFSSGRALPPFSTPLNYNTHTHIDTKTGTIKVKHHIFYNTYVCVSSLDIYPSLHRSL